MYSKFSKYKHSVEMILSGSLPWLGYNPENRTMKTRGMPRFHIIISLLCIVHLSPRDLKIKSSYQNKMGYRNEPRRSLFDRFKLKKKIDVNFYEVL